MDAHQMQFMQDRGIWDNQLDQKAVKQSVKRLKTKIAIFRKM